MCICFTKITQTSEINKACFDLFHSECSKSYPKITQTSEINKACFDLFYSECSKSYQKITQTSKIYLLFSVDTHK